MTDPMPVIVPTEGSFLSYPDVMPNATAWVWSDEPKFPGGVVLVTEHGLRRLLRLAAEVFPLAMVQLFKDSEDVQKLYAAHLEPQKLRTTIDEASSIWCEHNLVMSRLFIAKDGKTAIAHKDKEVDDASIPPWEKQHA